MFHLKMKVMKAITLMTGILFLVQTAVGQYVWQNPNPSGNPLRDIWFTDNATGWVVGECGTILKSVDGGVSWNPQFSGTDSDLNAVIFSTPDVGFAVGTSGTMVKTQDGGESWQPLNTGTGQNLTDVVFLDQENLWIAGDQGVILHSYNGGESWSAQFNLPGIAWVSANLVETETIGQCIIRIVGKIQNSSGNVLITSADGGGTWILQSIAGTSSSVRCLTFVDAFTGWVGGGEGCDGSLLRTTDGGTTWLPVYTGGEVVSVHCQDAFHITVLTHHEGMGGNNRVIRSDDGGLTWDTCIIWSSGYCNALWFSGLLNGIVAGYAPYPGGAGVYITYDGGLSWETYYSSVIGVYPLHDIQFLDTQQGWAVTGGGGMGGGRVYKTIDGGETWSGLECYSNLWSIYFTDIQHGWVTGWKRVYQFPWPAPALVYDSAFIRKTFDGGATWMDCQVDARQALYRIFFTDQQRGWVVGNEGTLLRSMDGGATWEEAESGTNENLYGLILIDENRGWVCGATGTILHTANGGETWEDQLSGTSAALRAIDFVGEDHGCAVGSNGTVVYTTNGGETWLQGISGTSDDLFDVDLYDEMNGIAVGEHGCVLKTHDGGSTWTKEFRPSHIDLRAVSIPDPDNFWLAGGNHIIHQGDGQVVDCRELFPTNEPGSFDCYPNPFHATFNITFRTEVASQIRLTLHSITGQEVARLLSASCPAGEHTVQYNGNNLSAGVYLCRLQAGDQTVVMRLIKL